MADDSEAPNLDVLANAAKIAATARQNEFDLYNKARAAGDVNGLTVHNQGYRTAFQVEQRANGVLAQEILNSPALATNLNMLADANKVLSAAAAALSKDTTALDQFTEAASAVLTVLGAIALL